MTFKYAYGFHLNNKLDWSPGLTLTSMPDHASPLRQEALCPPESLMDRLIHRRCVKDGFRSSFLPAVVRWYNQHR